jgi:DNA invertase Pin-like site-specific DNA recombinase
MAEGKFVAYYRVSTGKQMRSGLGLEAQKQAVANYLNGGRWKLVGEFTEQESGKRSDRPELAKALALCRIRKATLVIAKLDRLARNVHFVSGLMESNVDFVAVDFPTANRLTIHILAAVAEHEAQMISERTRAALQAAKARGVVLGRPNSDIAAYAKRGAAASVLARQRNAQKRTDDRNAQLDLIRADFQLIQKAGNTSLRQIAAALNDKHIPAPGGGRWHPNSVRRVMQ